MTDTIPVPAPASFRKGPPNLSDAVTPIAATIKPNHMTDPWDIGEALARLCETGEAVSIYSSSGAAVIMARILSVDEELPHFVLELNEGSKLPSGQATFVAWLQGAKLQFTLDSPWLSQPDNPTLLPAEFPTVCLVQERREAPRLEMPLGAYYTASFVLDGRPYELQLYDFSVGGVGMRAPPRETVGLVVGRKLPRVLLELGPKNSIIVDMEIRLSRSFRSFLVGEQVQVGCRFTDISASTQEQIRRLLEKLASGRRTM